ncbi:hypothetical protein Cni_G07944 [Canna indica]|uniref:Uncharacterized protein n=1 Tax=Canna indica TaxID=4628 RepID=A0AAQ3Q7V7_9LILI|nr:hypothetical protein Cni_G07944 [Canna indica]
MNEISFSSKKKWQVMKKKEEKEKANEREFVLLSTKMIDSFSKILVNNFAKEDFLEAGYDPERSRAMEKDGTKARKWPIYNDSIVNVPIMFRNAKPKKRRHMIDTIALGDEGDPEPKNIVKSHGEDFLNLDVMEKLEKLKPRLEMWNKEEGEAFPYLSNACTSSSSPTAPILYLSNACTSNSAIWKREEISCRRWRRHSTYHRGRQPPSASLSQSLR